MRKTLFLLLSVIAVAGLLACPSQNGENNNDATAQSGGNGGDSGQSPAEQTYVPPGEMDDYYLFYSGGHGSNVRVAGVPSLRHIKTIPVFAPDPGAGYGYDDKTEKMLGEYTWGDVHHPALSKTDGMYDGRWLFVNDNAHNRIARISLEDFKTKEILGPIPNTSGNHGNSYATENTEYLMGASRFATPLPKGSFAEIENYEEEFQGVITGIDVDQDSGNMDVGWQILTPPFQWDLSSTGKNISEDWAFFSSYNSEMAHELLEVGASEFDRDYGAFVNWRRAAEAVEEGNYTEIDGVPVIDPSEVEGVMYLVPMAKSPHGIDVDPSGRWVVASGKLEPSTTVFDFQAFQDAIEEEDFQGEVRGIPVVNYDRVAHGQVPTGAGPLHTEFDDRGNAYTSVFIDSQVTKWKLPPWTEEERNDLEQVVVDTQDVHYNIGHLVVPGADTQEPYGDWLVAMNKHAAGRHLPVGPAIPETSQLIDISGEEMELVGEAFTDKEPHFAQMIPADELDPRGIKKKANNNDPNAIWSPTKGTVERDGDHVTVKMGAVRSRFGPDNITVQEGDTVTIHITNTEQTHGMTHGFGIGEMDVNLSIDPGYTKTVTLEDVEPGVYPFYCTVFCSALHQEMQGYLAVEPADESDEESENE